MNKLYEPMLKLDRPKSKYPKMSQLKRAAQFASFDALDGYGAALEERSKTRVEKIELAEDKLEELNRTLEDILSLEQPEADITYFEPDQDQNLGNYITVSGVIIKYKPETSSLVLANGKEIGIDRIYKIRKI